MLPKKFHLTVSDYRKNPAKPKRLPSAFFTVFSKTSTALPTRFAILIPKKLTKHSSKRHQARRVVSEVVRKLLNDMLVSRDVLLKLNRLFSKKDASEVDREINRVFKKAGLIKNC